MNDLTSFIPTPFEWMTIFTVSVVICLLTTIILWSVRRYSNSVRHLVIATSMMAHLLLVPGFIFLPKLQFDVIPVQWNSVATGTVESKVDLPTLQPEQFTEVSELPSVPLEHHVQADAEFHSQFSPDVRIQQQGIALQEVIDGRSATASVLPVVASAPWKLGQILTVVWAIGFLTICTWFCLAHLWARRQVAGLARLQPSEYSTSLDATRKLLGVRGNPGIRIWEDNRIPMLLGIFRPVIIVPQSFRDWSSDRQRHVLMHELTHVARRDSIHDSIAWLATAFFWCNPLVWMLKRRQGQERELACDQTVVSLSSRPEDYADDLLSVVKEASGFGPSTAIAMARSSELRQRIESIVRFDPAILKRGKSLPRTMCGVLVASAILGSSLAFSQVALQEDSESQPEVELLTPDDFSAGFEGHEEAIAKVEMDSRNARESIEISASGKVLDASGKPVAGAEVFLRECPSQRRQETTGLNINLMQIFDSRERSFSIAKTATNKDGSFRFESVKSPMFLREIPNMVGQGPRWSLLVRQAGDSESGIRNWRWLEQPEKQESIEIVLPKPTDFKGVVLDADGNPVANANVMLDRLRRSDLPTEEKRQNLNAAQRQKLFMDFIDLANSPLSPRATTDSQGKFQIEGLPAGFHASFKVTSENFVPLQTDPLLIGQIEPTKFPLDAGWKLKFLAKNAAGEPVANALFRLTGKYNPEVGFMELPLIRFTTDESGEYLSPPLPKCGIDIHSLLDSETHPGKSSGGIARSIEVSAGESGTVVSAEMNFESGRVIHGHIVPVDKTKPITGSEFDDLVVLYTVVNKDTFNDVENYSAKPDSNGKFEIRVREGVEGQISVSRGGTDFQFDLPGTIENFLFSMRISERRKKAAWPKNYRGYVEEVDPLSKMPSRRNVMADDEFTSDKPIVLPVARSKTVQGVLVDVNGDPIPGATLKLLNRRQVNYGGDLGVSFPGDPVTDENGKFEIKGIQQRFVPFYQAIDPTNDLAVDIGWPPLGVEEGEEALWQLKPGPSVKVVVMLDGQPLQGEEVYLSTSFRGSVSGSPIGRKLMTDEQGVCVFKNLTRSQRNYITVHRTDQEHKSESISTLGDQIEFVAPEIRFISKGSGIVAGQVVDPAGKPVANVDVSAYEYIEGSRSSGKHFESVKTDAEGKFNVTKIPPNTQLKLRFSPEYPREARFPRSPIDTSVIASSGDKDLRIIVDPRLSQELPWRTKREFEK